MERRSEEGATAARLTEIENKIINFREQMTVGGNVSGVTE